MEDEGGRERWGLEFAVLFILSWCPLLKRQCMQLKIEILNASLTYLQFPINYWIERQKLLDFSFDTKERFVYHVRDT